MDALDADYHVAATVEDDGCINGSDIYIDRDFDPADAKATITTNMYQDIGCGPLQSKMKFASKRQAS